MTWSKQLNKSVSPAWDFELRKTTITSVQALLDKLPENPFFLELCNIEDPDGECEIVDSIPVLVLPGVCFSEYNGYHCEWLEFMCEGFNRVYPTDFCDEDLEDFLYDGQEIYVITWSESAKRRITNNNSHIA